ncbi:MAG: hypothetical protein ACOC1K_03175 [Nanoarchaeota archaeon]
MDNNKVTEIDKLVKEYHEKNSLKKKYDTERKSIGKKLQEKMEENNLSKYANDEVSISIITRTNKDVKEDKLVEVLNEYKINALKLAPDLDKIEKMIDNDELTKEEIEEILSCIKTNTYSYVTARQRKKK